MTPRLATMLLPFIALGLMAGIAWFATLHQTVVLWLRHDARAPALYLARGLAGLLCLAFAARAGAAPLMGALAGLLAARRFALRRWGRVR